MSGSGHVEVSGLRVDPALHDFVTAELVPGSGVTADQVWDGLAELVRTFAPRHRDLLAVRDRLQAQIDEWHRSHPAESHDPAAYRTFLESIGYLVPSGEPFEIDTAGVDPEIATLAGPQLVVPSTNARYSINAANARWGSLYDALYGTDAMGDLPEPGPYDPARGARVVAWTRAFLDDVVPLEDGSHADVVRYSVDTATWTLVAERSDGARVGLRDAAALHGYRGAPDDPSALLLEHHGLGIELLIDRAHPVGAADAAGVADVVLESAVTTIVDFEDSVATVDGPDKVGAYRTWLGLMKGDLTAEVTKGDRSFVRSLADDREYLGSRRRADRPAGSGAAARPQRRPPHDDAGRARRRRPAGAGGHRRRAGLGRRGDARPRPPGRRPQLPRRLHLRGQAQDARSGRGGADRRPVRRRRGGPRTGAEHDQGRDHGRGAPHHGQPRRVHPRRPVPRGVHQHRLPRPHRRRDPHLDAGRRHGAQGGHALAAVDPGLRGLERRHRPRLRSARAGPDRQGHVGRARPHGRPPRPEGRAPRWPGPAARGCRPRPRRRCTPPSTTGSTSASASASCPAARRGPRSTTCWRSRWPVPRRSGPTTSAEPRSTTTCRASSATSCAGSTRASAARRCPTSTASR